MIQLQTVGARVLVQRLQGSASEVREGVKSGIEESIKIVARDVAAHTPSKTGTARRAVEGKMTRPDTGVILHDFTKAFYMRFVLMGTKPHTITPKLSTARGLARARKNAKAKGLDPSTIRRKRALAIPMQFASVGGTVLFATRARHPGIMPRHIMSLRLAANIDTVNNTIQANIQKAFDRGLTTWTGPFALADASSPGSGSR